MAGVTVRDFDEVMSGSVMEWEAPFRSAAVLSTAAPAMRRNPGISTAR
jgi:hypothetical protein